MSESMNPNAMKQHNAVLSCRNLSKRYDEGPESVVVLDGLELELLPGERVAIVGSSGSGKSTLAEALVSALPQGKAVFPDRADVPTSHNAEDVEAARARFEGALRREQ